MNEIEPKRLEWSKWTAEQCRRGANTMVDDGNGNLVRACVKGGSSKKKRASHLGSCSTCKVVPRAPRSDMCKQCQTAVMLAFLQ